MQDVWIMKADGLVNTYGTTVRICDPPLEAWRVAWLNPITGRCDELIGRRQGADIVQIGRHADGTTIRWRFTEIANDSFHWIGEALNPDGVTWKLEAEFRGRRGAS